MSRFNVPVFASLESLASRAFMMLLDSGGFTLDEQGASPVECGYVISVPNCERKLSICFPHSLEYYFRCHPLRPGEYWGGWRDDSAGAPTFYLDVCHHFPTISEFDARTVGRAWGQRTIWDCARLRVIEVAPPAPPQIAHGPGGLRLQGDCDHLRGGWYAYDYSGKEAWEGPRRETRAEALADLEARKQELSRAAAMRAIQRVDNETYANAWELMRDLDA